MRVQSNTYWARQSQSPWYNAQDIRHAAQYDDKTPSTVCSILRAGLYAKQTFPVARSKRLTIVMQGTFVASHVTVITITVLQDILVSQSNSTYDLIGCCWSGGGSISSSVRDWGQRCTDVRGGQSRRIQWLANSTPNICWVTRSSLLKYARYVSRYRQ